MKKIATPKLIGLIIIGILVIVIAVQIINASKYRMVVNVVEGENIMGINPLAEKLDFGDLSRNNGMSRYVTLKSEGNTPVYIMVWKFGGLAELIKLSRNYFVLNPGEETKLEFSLFVPPSAETKKYSGWVWIFRIPKII